MLSEKIKEQYRAIEICEKDNTDFKKGMMFDRLVISNSRRKDLEDTPVIFLGFFDSDEMILCTADKKICFSLYDGWGVENNILYAISVGPICSFKNPITIENLKAELTNPADYSGVYETIRRDKQNNYIRKILKILKSE